MCGNEDISVFRVGYEYGHMSTLTPGTEDLCEPCLSGAIGWIRLALWKKQCGL